jgi:hypothetical protein
LDEEKDGMTSSYGHALRDSLRHIPTSFGSVHRMPAQLALIIEATHRRLCLLLRGKLERRPAPSSCCLRLPDVRVRPDPLLYSQPYLTSKGLAVTWDNPDIQLYENGTPIPSHSLHPNHEYEVRVRIWNGSFDAPAIGLRVALSYLSFGIATTSIPIGTTEVDLGAKGTINNPAFASFNWRTPREAGHYCLQARLDWADDANPDNNLGQENVQVGSFASPVRFSFRVRNVASVARDIAFEIDAYALPTQPPCQGRDDARFGRQERFGSRLAESRARWAWALEVQSRERYPVPEGWSVTIEPPNINLAAGAEAIVDVVIEARDATLRDPRPFNIHGFAIDPSSEGRRHIGGVTLVVSR